MNEYSVIYSTQALEDLRDIYAYIAYTLQERETAKACIAGIQNEAESLDFMPLRYAVVEREPWQAMGVRKTSVKNFSLYYAVDADAMVVTVVRVVYAGRDIANIMPEK